MTPPNIPDRALRDLGLLKPKPSTPTHYDPVTGEPWEEDQQEEQDDTTETYESEQGKRGHTQQ